MVSEPIYKAIKELRAELTRIDHIIAAVEAMADGKPRRGRPPKFIAEMLGDKPNGGKRGPKKTSAKSAK